MSVALRPWITPSEAARFLGVAESSVRRWAVNGWLPSRRRLLRLEISSQPLDEIAQFLAQRAALMLPRMTDDQIVASVAENR